MTPQTFEPTISGASTAVTNATATPINENDGKESFITQPYDRWPTIRGRQTGKFKGESLGAGGSAFLIRGPGDRILAVTARHLVDTKIPVRDLESQIESWVIRPDSGDGDALQVGGFVAYINDAVVLAIPNPPDRLPLFAPRVRRNSLRSGERVWLIGKPDGKRVEVFSGKVGTLADGCKFTVTLDDLLPQVYYSGSPILDDRGRAVGVFLGSHVQPDAKGRLSTYVGQELFQMFDDTYWTRRVELTAPAVAYMRELLKGLPAGTVFRLNVRPGRGDELIGSVTTGIPSDRDLRVTSNDIAIVIDPPSASYAIGVLIDYSEADKKLHAYAPGAWRKDGKPPSAK